MIPKIISIIVFSVIIVIDIVFIAKKKTKHMISTVLSIVICVVFIGIDTYQLANPDYDFVNNNSGIIASISEKISGHIAPYHDKKGNPVKDVNNMVYYDREDNAYHVECNDDSAFLVNETTNEKFDYYKCYIDSEGYFYYDEKGIIKYNEESGYCYDGTGTVYYYMFDTNWDRYGNLLNNNPNYH
ncbi:MAG: hypothetical protein NC213_08485 [Acetobacter sp.]|nr:hypothetical protein [Bacteroides sp.]MCM1341765.1 hypothetical protein [Acetobacter sp.]MCM1433108.1 hypothetical protein [Clostridiales bacterium]